MDTMKETIGPGCYIRLRGKTWHVVFTDKAKRPRQKERSLKTTNKAKASAAAYEMHRQRELGRFDPWKGGTAGTTLRDALRHYLRAKPNSQSARDCARLLERVCEAADVTFVAAITPELIADFIHRPGLSDSSRWSYHNKIAAVVNWMHRAGYFDLNPVADVTKPVEPQAIPRHYGEEDIERFLEYCRLYVEHNA